MSAEVQPFNRWVCEDNPCEKYTQNLYLMPERMYFLICSDQNESFFLDKVLPQHLQFTHTSKALRNRYGQFLLTRQRQQKSTGVGSATDVNTKQFVCTSQIGRCH